MSLKSYLFSFGLFFSLTQSFFRIPTGSCGWVSCKACLSPSTASLENLKSLPGDCWCIYLGSGLWRGWQIPHNEFAKCMLAAAGFKASWRRENKTQAWRPDGLTGRESRGARGFAHWHVNVRAAWSGSPADPPAIPPSTQSPALRASLCLCEAPAVLAAEASPREYPLCCKTPFWIVTVDGKVLPAARRGSGLFGMRSFLRIDVGPLQGFEMKMNTTGDY